MGVQEDFNSAYGDIQRRMKGNRERAETGEFRNPWARFKDKIDHHFDLADLGDLAFGLNVDLEKISVRDANKDDIIADLITHFQNRQRLDILIGAVHQARPQLEQPFTDFLKLL
jgi:hypothetical protein